MTARIFANARLQYKGWPKSKYDAKQLQEAIDHIILSRNQKEKDRLKNFKYPDDLCRTYVYQIHCGINTNHSAASL